MPQTTSPTTTIAAIVCCTNGCVHFQMVMITSLFSIHAVLQIIFSVRATVLSETVSFLSYQRSVPGCLHSATQRQHHLETKATLSAPSIAHSSYSAVLPLGPLIGLALFFYRLITRNEIVNGRNDESRPPS